MQLTRHTDYALRLLVDLAQQSPGTVIALPDFAARQHVSYNHIAKVAQALTRAGYVVSHRGRSGGVSLARDPGEIALGSVVRDMEPRLFPVDCSACVLRSRCGLPSVLGEAMAEFLAVLDRKTLAQVADNSGA